MTALAIQWQSRETPREPLAALGMGAVAKSLARATLRRLQRGAELRSASSASALLVLGAPDDLPWADGVTYLVREGDLWLPATLTPGLPIDLLTQAVRQSLTPQDRGKDVAMVPGLIITFRPSAGATDPVWLERWVEAGATA